MQTFDAAVIGGGIAGLIAAIELAKANKQVVLLEKASKAGGRAITLDKNGARFNLGGHALYKEGEAYSIFQEYGLKLPGGSPKASGAAIWNNKAVPLPGDPLTLLSSRILSWRGKVAFGKLMAKLGQINPHALGRISLRDWAEHTIQDPMVRHIVYALFRTSTYSKDIDYQLIGPVLQQVQRALKSGVLYIDGGWQTIIDQLRDHAIRLGVTIKQNSNAAEIIHLNGAVTGLRLTGSETSETLNVHQVIAAIPPTDLRRLIRDADQTVIARWVNEARPITAACLDLCLKKLPVANRHFALGIDQPVFFSNHSRVAKLTENGTIVVHLIKYNDFSGNDSKSDEKRLEQTMDILHPNWRQEVVARQYLPAITVAHDHAHIGRTVPQPGPAVPEIRGLYVAGDWAGHNELLADAAAASAKRAAGALLQQLTRKDVYHVV